MTHFDLIYTSPPTEVEKPDQAAAAQPVARIDRAKKNKKRPRVLRVTFGTDSRYFKLSHATFCKLTSVKGMTLGKHGKQKERILSRSSKSAKIPREKREGFVPSLRRLLCFPQVLENHTTAARLLGLALISRIYPQIMNQLPPLPKTVLTDIGIIPETLVLLLNTTGGTSEWSGKAWQIIQPRILGGNRLPQNESMRLSLSDYTSCRVRAWKQEVTLQLPYLPGPVAFPHHVPERVAAEFMETSPLCWPIYIGRPKKTPKEMLLIPGEQLYVVNRPLFAELDQDTYYIAKLIDGFVTQCQRKRGFAKQMWGLQEQLSCSVCRGKYSSRDVSSEAEFAVGTIAILTLLLRFCQTHSESRDIVECEICLQQIKHLLLPNAGHLEFDASHMLTEPTQFFRHLRTYLADHTALLCGPDGEPSPETVARLRYLSGSDDSLTLILPRQQYMLALVRDCGCRDVDEKKWDEAWATDLQKTLAQAGIPFKSERNSVQWRYQFYPNGSTQKGKVNCLGIRVCDLPDDLRVFLIERFGLSNEVLSAPLGTVLSSDIDKEAE